MIQKGWLRFTTEETGEVVEIPVLPAVQSEIERAPKDNMTFLDTPTGARSRMPVSGCDFGVVRRRRVDRTFGARLAQGSSDRARRGWREREMLNSRVG